MLQCANIIPHGKYDSVFYYLHFIWLNRQPWSPVGIIQKHFKTNNRIQNFLTKKKLNFA